jgi:hypothetical protein
MSREEEKGEWAETAEEGIVPEELSGSDDADFVGREAASDEPATEDGVDLSAGDHADATTQGGQNRPDDEEPDLRDAAGGPRQVDIDSAS